jgi:hypothetical protein
MDDEEKKFSETAIAFPRVKQTFWHYNARHQTLRLTGIFYHTHNINILQIALPCFFRSTPCNMAAQLLCNWLWFGSLFNAPTFGGPIVPE